jgi:ribonuclease P protein subunit RPR2
VKVFEMSRGRKRSKSKIDKKMSAKFSLDKLISIIKQPQEHDERIIRSASSHYVKISMRNRMPLSTDAKLLICKKCSAPRRYGLNTRVRISAGQKITTCLECGDVRRFGGGPKSHRHQ